MSKKINRRNFVKTAAVAASATLFAPAIVSANAAPKRYAIVGTGHRGTGMWGKDLADNYKNELQFVGLCDKNYKRAEAGRKLIGVECPTFTNFDEMLEKTKPDILMVTTMCSTHHEFITKGVAKGIKVMTEKPMTTEAKDTQAVLDAEKRYKNPITVTFNYRYSPKHQQIKEILDSGEIGKITSVDFSWYLDVYHGADYFRRWHRLKAGGGSLWVHKATHHFDLVNWWINGDPVEVSAFGALNVYGKNGKVRAKNCRECPYKSSCEFYWDINKDQRLVKLYNECEDVDGYNRDGCVFREDCDIYDAMNAIVKYSNGVNMSYSLNAHEPLEGYRIAFNGTKGRLEVRDFERQPWKPEKTTEMEIVKNFKQREIIEPRESTGDHGGGDRRMKDLIFKNIELPKIMQLPDSRAGAMSCLTGIAARTSIEQSRPVKISELVKL
ncbi:MAG: Gfo/Idh/MocA family oxidoreductase [Pyrinomonadaceae bacterium]|nr:Gfo/Idh/MocA family oxidoreductase [Pyrinomonadaceae bacterium]